MSPYGAMLVGTGVFMLGWLFPGGLYTYYVGEPDRMFLDPYTILFFAACVAAVTLGLRTSRLMHPERWACKFRPIAMESPFLYICIPVALGCAFCIGALIHYGAKINFIALLMSQQGQTIKEFGKHGGLQQGVFTFAPHTLLGIIWWAYYRVRQLRLTRSARFALLSVCATSFMLVEFTAVAMVSRDVLIFGLGGVCIITIFARESTRKLRLGKVVLYAIAACGLAIGLFLVVALLRGGTASHLIMLSLLGYSITSYNRLASLLHGQLRFVYGGTGVYLFSFLQSPGLLEKMFHYQESLHWPDFQLIFTSEFSSVSMAGLNPRFNWPSVFGYIYADIGWAALIYLYGAGVFVGEMWGRFKMGTAVGLTMYPWIAQWIMFWSGTNILFNGDAAHLFFSGLAVMIWDKLFMYSSAIDKSPTADVDGPLTLGRKVIRAQ